LANACGNGDQARGAFADKVKHKYEKSQAGSQANDCGNGDTPIDVFCQALASQIQGDFNTQALAGEQD
jgi:hypothetical protein